jgi:superfamily I DNA and/or RNA helicase
MSPTSYSKAASLIRPTGFVDDVGRCNVAITRAKEVLWIIGGSMSLRRRFGHSMSLVEKPTALLTKYKRELDAEGKSHRFV